MTANELAARLVRGDELTERGDPRGELIVVHHELQTTTARPRRLALLRREQELAGLLRARVGGGVLAGAQLQDGFCSKAVLRTRSPRALDRGRAQLEAAEPFVDGIALAWPRGASVDVIEGEVTRWDGAWAHLPGWVRFFDLGAPAIRTRVQEEIWPWEDRPSVRRWRPVLGRFAEQALINFLQAWPPQLRGFGVDSVDLPTFRQLLRSPALATLSRLSVSLSPWAAEELLETLDEESVSAFCITDVGLGWKPESRGDETYLSKVLELSCFDRLRAVGGVTHLRPLLTSGRARDLHMLHFRSSPRWRELTEASFPSLTSVIARDAEEVGELSHEGIRRLALLQVAECSVASLRALVRGPLGSTLEVLGLPREIDLDWDGIVRRPTAETVLIDQESRPRPWDWHRVSTQEG